MIAPREAPEFDSHMQTIASQMEQYLALCERAAPLVAVATPELQQHWADMLERVRRSRKSLQRALRAGERIEKVLGKALKPRRWGIGA